MAHVLLLDGLDAAALACCANPISGLGGLDALITPTTTRYSTQTVTQPLTAYATTGSLREAPVSADKLALIPRATEPAIKPSVIIGSRGSLHTFGKAGRDTTPIVADTTAEVNVDAAKAAAGKGTSNLVLGLTALYVVLKFLK